MSYGPNDKILLPADTDAAALARTRPKPTMASKRFARWCISNPLHPKETPEGRYGRYMASLPRGDKIICNVICVPTPRAKAKGRRPYHATRVVDRKIWAKLDNAARGRWIERIRAEVIGA